MSMGFVKLHRELSNWEWVDSPNHLSVFINLLVRVNYQPKSWHGVKVEAGQIITGRKKIALWTGLSERQVRTVLRDLEKAGEVTIKTTNKFSIISMTKWAQFQTEDQQTTNKRPRGDQQTTTTKERKERKNIVSPLISLNLSEELNNWCNSIPHSTAKNFIETYDSNFLKEEIENAWLWNQEQVPSKQKKSPARFLANWFKRSNNENKLIKKNGNGGTVLDESFLKFFKGE